mmetsp:Transcript_72304/g.191872  ORF Transcript_72304/g.191872 Transcript_72304/m.191872 type:complete len:203 (+) Transcript_72304:680-1288(+)
MGVVHKSCHHLVHLRRLVDVDLPLPRRDEGCQREPVEHQWLHRRQKRFPCSPWEAMLATEPDIRVRDLLAHDLDAMCQFGVVVREFGHAHRSRRFLRCLRRLLLLRPVLALPLDVARPPKAARRGWQAGRVASGEPPFVGQQVVDIVDVLGVFVESLVDHGSVAFHPQGQGPSLVDLGQLEIGATLGPTTPRPLRDWSSLSY